MLGADVRLGAGVDRDPARRRRPASSPRPGWRPDRAAARRRPRDRGVPVWGEVELAWRLRDPDHAAPVAGGHRHQRQDHDRADARRDPARRRPAQRRRRQRRAADRRGGDGPRAVRRARGRAVQLPAALHRLDERASPPRCSTSPRTTSTGTRLAWTSTPPTRAGSTSGSQRACVYNVADPMTERAGPRGRRRRGRPRDRLHPRHARRSGWSAWSTTSSPTARSSSSGESSAAELCTIADLASPAPHFVANALAAAALARAHGVPPAAVRDGLRGVPARRAPDRRRRPRSTASPRSTTPRPPTRTPPSPRCSAYDPVVWVAGGLAKGAAFDELVRAVRDRLRGVVLLGRDRARDRRRACATRARCAGDRRRRRRD